MVGVACAVSVAARADVMAGSTVDSAVDAGRSWVGRQATEARSTIATTPWRKAETGFMLILNGSRSGT